jgi:hypothetical protein
MSHRGLLFSRLILDPVDLLNTRLERLEEADCAALPKAFVLQGNELLLGKDFTV